MKQVILMRTDLGMSKGKMCAQTAHASVQSTRLINPNHEWYFEGMPKIVLKVKDFDQLLEITDLAKQAKLSVTLVTDATLEQVTCGCIGPCKDEDIDPITNELKLL